MAFDFSWLANPWIVFLIVLGFLVWKFILEPIANEGQPIDPDPEESSD